ncbi:homoprotocatechuate degradation operon regulator HpaR [Neptuniibacter sp. QD29_5]|uniref:homoprotocatechuate degradation operon regulator HpaR n=1 Tax=unclassified Neptuniibacter TaxID=2630693 RepID=UPI0039F708E4
MRTLEDSLPLQLLKAREATLSFVRPLLQENSLTEQQWRVLQTIKIQQELESKALAELCCILSPSLTGILKRLEQQGYIQRRKSEEDKRRILISLTAKSVDLIEQLTPAIEERYQAFSDRYDQDKLKQLMTLLAEIEAIEP